MTPFEKEKQHKMLEFLAGHFKSLSDLTGRKDYVDTRGPTDHLSYGSDEERFVIGFDYSGGGFDREYVHRVCAWMALIDGKRKKFNDRELPYVIYDGCEDIAIVQKKISKDIDHIVVDENGFHPMERDLLSLLVDSVEFRRTNSIMKKEFQRLTQAYKALK